MNKTLKLLVLAAVVAAASTQIVVAQEQKSEDYMPSLITKTPLEGRMLAIKIVRKTIGAIQRSPEIKMKVRKEYEDDPALLMEAAELVAREFKTIAIANDYWR